MGLRLETYNENFVDLIADFSLSENSEQYCTTNNVEEAMSYFNLYIDPRTNRLKRNDPNQLLVDELAINIDNVKDFISQLGAITSSLSDAEALNLKLLFEEWNPEKNYEIGDRVRYNNVLYKCLLAHNALEGWIPFESPLLWKEVLAD